MSLHPSVVKRWGGGWANWVPRRWYYEVETSLGCHVAGWTFTKRAAHRAVRNELKALP